MGKPTEQGLWADSMGSLDLGMNSDVPAVSLPRNQAAMLTNCTVRGGFVKQRSAYQDITLSFDSSVIQGNFETGLFQTGSYYKPDFGPECLVAVIAGKFFKVVPSSTTATVSDISASDDNLTTSTQQWAWQGEQFLIINDGVNPPAIYDGANTFRAAQGETIATISSTWTVPEEGVSVAVTFTELFTGPFNKPVYAYAPDGTLLGTFEVNEFSSSSGYSARLTNIDDTPGTVQPSGSDIEILNSWSGESSTAGTPTTYNDGVFSSKNTMQQNDTPGSLEYQRQTVDVTPQFTGSVGSRIVWPTLNKETVGFTALETIVISVTNGGTTIKVERDDRGVDNQPYVAIPANAAAQLMNSGPNSLVSITTANFTAPAVGSFIDVTVDRLITVSGQVVYVNGKRYTVAPTPPAPGSALYLKAINPFEPGTSVLANATLGTIPQLPPSRAGVYGLGRNWVVRPDGRTYLGSDIVGSGSGSIAYKYRDSILNITENNYLAGGGVFYVPTSGQQINALAFPATLDSSLGQGPLQVFTQGLVFSCNAPVQRAEWQVMTNPIQTQSLVGGGSLGATVAVNGDLWFRSWDGIRSLKLARQDFIVSYSNTPQSVEMERVLAADNRSFLNFWHGVVFDNRMLSTANPTASNRGTYHPRLVALNLDPNSSLRDKQPPCYDGVWEDRNVLKVITGEFSGVQRAFAFVYIEATQKIGLTEIFTTPSDGSGVNQFDNGTERIRWSFETPAFFYQPDAKTRQLMRLNDGEIVVADIIGPVRFDVYYRPDYSTEWQSWHSWEVPASPTYQPRMGFGQPNLKAGDTATGRPFAVGYHFQLKVIVTGPCKILGINLYSVSQSETQFAKPIDSGLTPLTP